MEKEVVEVATKEKKAEEVEEAEVEVDLAHDTVNMELILNTRDCVVL